MKVDQLAANVHQDTLVTTGCAQINVSNVHAVISSLFVLAKN